MGQLKALGAASVALAVVVAASACGSGDGSTFGDGSSGNNSSGGNNNNNNQLANATADTGVPDELAGCATEQRKATPLPLDLYIMLDTSGSMSTQVAQSVSKYQAVKDALGAFVADPGSDGIGVGLQFFPLPTAGTPASCTASSDCPGTGPCSLKVCAQNGALVFCDTNANCPGGVTCISAGLCANAKNVYCGVGNACGNDANGFDRGTCMAQSAGSCSNADSCVDTDYSTPAVAIDTLPGAAGAITGALAAKEPAGNTPTSAALKGAVEGAKAYADAHPGHTVIAVLATDGLPTECDTSVANISTIAATAFADTTPIKTFVIGVFAADEAVTAQPNLDQIAAAGGSTSAFIVTQGATTTAQFIAAMNTIRGTALPCDYVLPVPEAGTPDFDKMNVQHTAPSGTKTVFPNKAGAGACDAAGGWYYDVDPASGGTPTKIVLCPTTCSDVKAQGGQVDVVVGCKTQVR